LVEFFDKDLLQLFADLSNISGGLCFCAASSNGRRPGRISLSMPGRRRQNKAGPKGAEVLAARPLYNLIAARFGAGMS
jgi:hypothetical protein